VRYEFFKFNMGAYIVLRDLENNTTKVVLSHKTFKNMLRFIMERKPFYFS